MGKSFRKRPIIGNAADTDKWDKRKANRILRHLIKQKVKKKSLDFSAEVLPDLREVSDEWSFNKDGKHYMDRTSELYEKFMKK